MLESEKVQAAVKKALSNGLATIQQERDKAETKRAALLEELKQVDASILELDRVLHRAIRDTLKELNIRPEPTAGRKHSHRKHTGQTIHDWLTELLRKHGSLRTQEIREYAVAAGMNPKSVSMDLSQMTKAGTLKAEGRRGPQGMVYSLA
ncbi:MAG: hypothetical protein JXA69_12060 [Phycisphaerae bacterium]|nr:hypothetical protein [Phycisphaerae bacterium]